MFFVKTHSIVEIDIGAGKGDHSFLLLYIGEKIYILDSYADLRTPEIRIFDEKSFRNYVCTNSLDSYNKVFNTNFNQSTDIGILRVIDVHIHEY